MHWGPHHIPLFDVRRPRAHNTRPGFMLSLAKARVGAPPARRSGPCWGFGAWAGSFLRPPPPHHTARCARLPTHPIKTPVKNPLRATAPNMPRQTCLNAPHSGPRTGLLAFQHPPPPKTKNAATKPHTAPLRAAHIIFQYIPLTFAPDIATLRLSAGYPPCGSTAQNAVSGLAPRHNTRRSKPRHSCAVFYCPGHHAPGLMGSGEWGRASGPPPLRR